MKITIQNIIKKFGDKTAVSIPEFSIADGDIIGLVGNNGAGKTTLFRLLTNLLEADEGTVFFQQDDTTISPAESEDWKKFTGVYLDDSFLLDFLTPEEYFKFVAKIEGIDEDTLQERLSAFTQFMNDEVMQPKLIRDFSAGNKQKIGIIGAMLKQPDLLILDEPFNYLDPSGQNQLKSLLTEYNQKSHATILVSSHNLQFTTDISNRIVLMEKGQILKDLDGKDEQAKAELNAYFYEA